MNDECILAIIEDLEDSGFDLQYDQCVYQWQHPQRPDVQLTLYIGEHSDEQYDFDRILH